MRLLTLTFATLALLAPFASANAAPPVRAGVLQCQGGQNVGFVVGSVTSLRMLMNKFSGADRMEAPCRKHGASPKNMAL